MKEWKIKLIALAVILLVFFLADMKLRQFSSETREQDGSGYVSCIGKVVDIDAGKAVGEAPTWSWLIDGQILTIQILSGRYEGQKVFAANVFIGERTDRVFKQGDKLYISVPLGDEKNIGKGSVTLGEYVRTPFLLYLSAIFIGLVVIIGGIKGIRSVLALLFSLVFIVAALIPMCLRGYSPIWVAVLISVVNTVLTFLLIGEVSKKSFSGVFGAIGGLLTTALLAYICNRLLHFTGLDISFGFLDLGKRLWLSNQSTNWNFSGLLTAGMILGASGAIMDSSMAVASAIAEVKSANPKIGIWRCVMSGLNVGKDEMGTMANTLIFAYIGADMTVILMPMLRFGEAGRVLPLTRIINEEALSAEIVQALAGTIGLIMAIPVTALIAGFLIGRGSAPKTKQTAMGVELPPKVMGFKAGKIRTIAIPIVLLLLALGIHVAYIITRQSIGSQIVDKKDDGDIAEYARAKVIEKSQPIKTPSPVSYPIGPAENEILKARLLGGHFKGDQVLVQNIQDPNRMPLYNINVSSGGEILLKIDGTKQGITRTLMVNYSRDGYLVYLAGLFVFLMVMVGRFQGIRTALALGISITIVFKVMLPLIVAGYNALLVVIVISGVIAFSSLVIITGFNRKAGSATFGILGGVIVASLVVLYADQKLHFTGISSSRTAIAAQFTVSQSLDFRKILMAGIVMGLLGTAMDAAVVVASAVREVKSANPKMPIRHLFKAGMNVGTDVLGTMTNTLIFAYLGLRIILLMTFAGTSIFPGNKMEIMSAETISAEILRLLAGSIGLVLTIPITAVASALWDKIIGFLGFGGRSV